VLNANATVTVCHSKTRDLAATVGRADLLVAAVGRPQMIRGDWVKPGAVVIDVGINRTAEGKLLGDVEYAAAAARAAAITPVPGGVGPMTIAMLLANTVTAAKPRAAQPTPRWYDLAGADRDRSPAPASGPRGRGLEASSKPSEAARAWSVQLRPHRHEPALGAAARPPAGSQVDDRRSTLGSAPGSASLF
jgi:hypothetical protein